MTYPVQQTQVIANKSVPLTLDAQIQQAASAFGSAAITLAQSTTKNRFVSHSAAKRMGMLKPRHITFYDDHKRCNQRDVLPRNDTAQCRALTTIIAQMFPASKEH